MEMYISTIIKDKPYPSTQYMVRLSVFLLSSRRRRVLAKPLGHDKFDAKIINKISFCNRKTKIKIAKYY